MNISLNIYSSTLLFALDFKRHRSLHDLPVRLVNLAEQVIKSAPDPVSFTGKETFDEAFAKAQQTFADSEVTSIKLGRLHGVKMNNFSGLGMREYMRKNILKPSATGLYAVCDEQAKKAQKGKEANKLLG